MDYGKCYVIALRLSDGSYDLVDGSDVKFTKREVRRAYKRFKGDADVVDALCMDAARFFDSRSEMIAFFKDLYERA